MKITVHPSFMKGRMLIPPSKSYTQRALLASLLAEGTSEIMHAGISGDELRMLEAISNLGAKVTHEDERILIQGGLHAKTGEIDMGESGLGIRLMTPVAAMVGKQISITGKGSLRRRPMMVFEKALKEAGGDCQTHQGFLPLEIKGPLTGGTIKLDSPISSQFLSGLLFALPLAEEDSTIVVKNLKSIPYIEMTLEALKTFGIQIQHHHHQVFEVPGQQRYQPAKMSIEGDWSNAAFFFTGAAIHGELSIAGLNPDSVQGDRKILEALSSCGAYPELKKEAYRIASPGKLKAFDFDATDCPDLFPPLAALASYCHGTSSIRGVHRLLHKESNRAEAIARELAAQGIEASLHADDTLRVTGEQPAGGGFHSHNDHRMAMTGSIVALKANSPVKITQAEAVGKSYPTFFETLQKLGVKLTRHS